MAEKFEYFSKFSEGDKRSVRYRNWDLLRYWFRGVENMLLGSDMSFCNRRPYP